MLLANGEALIKNWEYATSKVHGKWTKSTLTITNKRIVATAKNSRRVDQTEIPLQSVKGVYCRQEKPAVALAVVLLIIGLVLLAVGITSIVNGLDYDPYDYEMYSGIDPIVGTYLTLGGIVLAVNCIIYLCTTKGKFVLILTTEGVEGEPLTVGVSKIFGRRKGRDVKIKRINHDVAAEIIDSLGAIIMTYKN